MMTDATKRIADVSVSANRAAFVSNGRFSAH